jgi:hypothetical protein
VLGRFFLGLHLRFPILVDEQFRFARFVGHDVRPIGRLSSRRVRDGSFNY